ncbi:MAG TPA: LysM peptidoglycan-binding domain-containing protein, partial [Chloroflexota bacterium]|nr:LysM peptidoglycan-binding domain-containing protein [Chloroflexota bacterium]
MSDVNHAVRTPQSGAGAPRTGGASLAGLLLALAAGGWLLYRLSGRPRLPRSLPAPEAIWQALQRPDLPLDAALPVLAALAWALWLWLVVSVVLRLAVLAADGLTQGAAWVGALRRLSDRLTLPVVRRVIDGAVVAGVVVSLAGRASPAAAAAIEDVPASVTYQAPPPAPPHSGPPEPADPEPALPAVPSTPAQRIAGQPAPPDVDDQAPPQVAVYRVKAGDNLWHIAERYYGSGEAFPLLVEANAGRRMPDGRTFTRSGVIHPGWELHIPLPADILEEADGQTYYVVQPGDTLQGIASRLLGSADAWPAIFTANRGVASLPDGRILRDPDVIWPGLRLKVAQ